MLTGQLALIAAARFAGAAVYINVAEQPARRGWTTRPSSHSGSPPISGGFAMQDSLAVLGFLAGVSAWWHWLLGALILVANWPYTLIAVSMNGTQPPLVPSPSIAKGRPGTPFVEVQTDMATVASHARARPASFAASAVPPRDEAHVRSLAGSSSCEANH
jgi:hypothetical protein